MLRLDTQNKQMKHIIKIKLLFQKLSTVYFV